MDAGALPPDVGLQFRKRVRERAYSRVFRPTAVQRLFKEAMRLEDLTSETLEAIASMEAAYLSELELINVNILRLIRQYEPAEAQYRADNFARRGQEKPEKPSDPSRAEFRRRDDMGKRYVEQLQAMLTPEQFQSLKGAQRFLRKRGSRDASAFGADHVPPGDGKARKKEIRSQTPPRLGGAAPRGGSGGGN